MPKAIQELAIVDGKLCNIQEFRHLVGDYENRPIAICPIDNCGCEMEMVLPKDELVRRSHFRHISKSDFDHSPETIWHFAAKHHIATQLKQGVRIVLNWSCSSQYCSGSHKLPPLLDKKPDYIDVDSKKIGGFLPDIALYHDDKPIGVIEVFNTHQSTQEKIDFYKEIGLPWLEISVQSEKEYQQVMNWKGGEGLSGLVRGIHHAKKLPALCPECGEHQEYNRRQQNQRQRRNLEAHREKLKAAAAFEKEEAEYKKNLVLFHQNLGERTLAFLKENHSLPIVLDCPRCGNPKPVKVLISEHADSYEIGYLACHDDVRGRKRKVMVDVVIFDKKGMPVLYLITSGFSETNFDKKMTLRWLKDAPFFIEVERSSKKGANGKFAIMDSPAHFFNDKPYPRCS